jgi:K+-transporting ATPase ATPase A chain
MITNELAQILLYVAVLLLLVKPLGWYMARVYEGKPVGLDRVLGPLERLIYRLCDLDPQKEVGWKWYALAALAFNAAGFVLLYVLQRVQHYLPLNPEHLSAVKTHTAFNAAVSFVTNTNWQSYGGETTMSYLTQMLGMTVQNFVSAATGMAVLVAMIRGFARRNSETIGNFWVDMTRSVLYILLPVSILWAVALMSQGVVQTYSSYHKAALVEPVKDADGKMITEQTIAVGPAASQIAIKQLGTNGGGFFNANSAHPFENPTPLSNFLEVLAILLIPAALCYTFGKMVGDVRQGWAVLAAMGVIFVAMLALCWYSERHAPPWAGPLGIDTAAGNMEGKEVRFGVANSALWATATTSASNGSVNSMHDSYTPLGGLVPLLMIQLGEVVFGGVGSGLYGMLIFAVIAVFIAGLMVGRTPEYLGKKIEAFEIKMAALAILIPVLLILIGTGVAVMVPGPGCYRECRSARFRRSCTRSRRRATTARPRGPHADTLLHPRLGWHARRAVLGPSACPGHRRVRGPQEDHADERRHPADAWTAVCRPPGGRGAHHRRAVFHPGPRSGADCRAFAHGAVR